MTIMDYDYIPKNVVIGSNGTDAYVTCKYKMLKWKGESTFESFCGYKPHVQRDAAKELKKAICAAVFEIENAPTNGFKLVNFNADMYKLDRYSYIHSDVVVADPRGFNVCITFENFKTMLSNSNMCLENGKFDDDNKYVYAWNNRSQRFSLICINDKNYVNIEALSRIADGNITDVKYITPSKLKEGKIYNGSIFNSGLFLYVGRYDIYSVDCHDNAIRNGIYNVDAYSKRQFDDTKHGAYVFYRLDNKKVVAPNGISTAAPYVMYKSIVRKFNDECTTATLSNYSYYKDGSQLTLDKIKNEVEHSIAFNQIDFNKKFSMLPMSKEVFADFLRLRADKFKLKFNYWPIVSHYSAKSFLYSQTYAKFLYIGVAEYNNKTEKYDICLNDVDYDYLHLFYSKSNKIKCTVTVDELYDMFRPMYYDISFTNGMKPEEHMVNMLDFTKYRNTIKNIS